MIIGALFLAATAIQESQASTLPFNAGRIDEQSRMPQALPLRGYIELSEKSYPKGPLKRKVDGVVGVTVRVDAQGKFQGCEIWQSSRDAELDDGTCVALRNAQPYFRPAYDREGRAVVGAYSRKVNWVLPHSPR